MRIAIVNDLAVAVEAMRRTLRHARGHELAWVARDGVEAVERCAKDTPDLVLMDLIMPQMDGVEATRQIMAHTPCAIVVVTASVDQHTSKVFEAMGAGALDAVDTPILERTGNFTGTDALLGKIQTIQRLLSPGPLGRTPLKPRPVALPSPVPRRLLVAIGASAGGPAALARVLSQLPGIFPRRSSSCSMWTRGLRKVWPSGSAAKRASMSDSRRKATAPSRAPSCLPAWKITWFSSAPAASVTPASPWIPPTAPRLTFFSGALTGPGVATSSASS